MLRRNIASISYTDSAGNIWYVRSDVTQAATANNVQELAILTSRLTANTTSSTTLNVTLTVASTAEAWTITEASSSISGAVVAYENSFVTPTSVNATTTNARNF
jgi:hypothetical protein